MGSTPPPKRHRAPITIPSLAALSSNWKRLQESLKRKEVGGDKGDGAGGVRIMKEEGEQDEEVVDSSKRKDRDRESKDKRERIKSKNSSREKEIQSTPTLGREKRKADEISKKDGVVSRKHTTPITPTSFSTSTSTSTTKKKRKMPETVVDEDGIKTPTITALSRGKQRLKSHTPSALAAFAQDNDISPEDLARAYGLDIKSKSKSLPPSVLTTTTTTTKSSISTKRITTTTLHPPAPSTATLGKYLSLDCEMIGFGSPPPYDHSQVARVSLVNYHGQPIYDTFVLPTHPVTDWRTPISGIRPSDMAHAIPFHTAREQVSTLLQGRILVGHALQNDLKVLNLKHPRQDCRDTSKLEMLRKMYGNGQDPALRKLSREVLGVEIQGGEHSSVVDANAAMLVYRRFKREFEEEVVRLYGRRRPGVVPPRVVVNGVGGLVGGVNGVGAAGEDGEGGSEGESDDNGENADDDDGGKGGGDQKRSGERKKRNRNKKKKKKGKYK